MTRRIAWAGVILAAALAVAACSSSSSRPAPTAPATLPGTSWLLSLQGGSAPAARQLPTLVFGTDGTVSGFTGCQPYTGTFTANGSSLSFAGLTNTPTSTQCAPDVVTVADAFIAALGGVTGWSTQVLPAASGVTMLQPVRLLLAGTTPLVLTLQ
jgi:heat shock protein HslJ